MQGKPHRFLGSMRTLENAAERAMAGDPEQDRKRGAKTEAEVVSAFVSLREYRP